MSQSIKNQNHTSSDSKYVAEINRLEAELSRQYAENNLLNVQLASKTGIKNQIGELYRAVDGKILHVLDTKGRQKRKPRIRKDTLATQALTTQKKDELVSAAHAYDARIFFTRKSSSSEVKMHYRVATKLYRTGRDTLKQTAKLAYKTVKKRAKS